MVVFYVSESTKEKYMIYHHQNSKIPFLFLLLVNISPHDEGPGGMYMYIDI